MQTLQFAKSLRTNQTEAEQKLWYHLRGHRFLGAKFKRQKPVGPYIADFICLTHKLLIEVDGGQHNQNESRDRERDQWFIDEGYTVLRFWNHDVLQQTENVLEQIRLALECGAPSPLTPLPQAGEGN